MLDIKQTVYWDMLGDAFRLFGKYIDTEDADDSFWESLTTEANSFHNKYESQFALDLEVAMLSELERIGTGKSIPLKKV